MFCIDNPERTIDVKVSHMNPSRSMENILGVFIDVVIMIILFFPDRLQRETTRGP